MATDTDKLQAIADHLDKIHAGIDGVNEKHDAMGKRFDAIEAGHKELAERLEKLEKDDEDETPEQKAARERADKERIDAAVAAAYLPPIDQDADKFAAIQMRADAAFQAWGKQAPHALHGEALKDYRIRLLAPHKQHSRKYADSALNLIGDDAVFETVENAIIADSIAASNSAETVGVGNLRKVVTRSDLGHTITKFIGDPAACWGQFSGGHTRFGKIVRPASK